MYNLVTHSTRGLMTDDTSIALRIVYVGIPTLLGTEKVRVILLRDLFLRFDFPYLA